ncbi:unnamed protein product [Urochloa humidicola]
MRPLDVDDSRRLLFSRIFGFGEACPDAYENLSVDILKRCGGLPLAIISIASLLAGQPKVTWEYVHKSLCSMFEANPNLEDMKRILDLSYRNLPHHLKACLLYLGMYPEDYTIMKNDLVRQWIAEGFVSSIHGLDAEDIAGSYFNELINKNMIQPVLTDYNDEVISCKVHDLMLDLIRVKSGEDNFLDVIDDLEVLTKMNKKTRRLSLHYACEGYSVTPTKIKGSLCQIRSVVAFTEAFLPSYQGFKYIRVLSLHFWTGVSGASFRIRKIDLTSICRLYLLRYLKIVSNTGLELPDQLWSLQYLETMDLQPLADLSIPSDIVRLGRLLHLTVPFGTAFQDDIGSLKSLRTLHGFDFSRSSLNSIESLGELTNLRDLQLSCLDCGNVDDLVMESLRFSLERLSHPSSLKSLCFSHASIPHSHLDWFNTLSSFPYHLQKLHPQGFRFSRIPKWIAQLHDLYSLQLVVREIVPKDDDIGILAGLPCLAHLYLNFIEAPEERIIIPGGAGVAFPALKQLNLKCPKLFPVIDVGAMPRLEKLELSFSMVRWEDMVKWLQPNGIDNLPVSTKKVLLCCYGQITGEDTTSAVRSVFSAHHPGVDLIFSGFL